ncbi:hypothetical protein ACHAW6_010321 [Cyclotella cf. meneghiniana]
MIAALRFWIPLAALSLSLVNRDVDPSRSSSLFEKNSTDDDDDVLATTDEWNGTAPDEWNGTAPHGDDDESFLPSDDVEWYLPQVSRALRVFAAGSSGDWGDDDADGSARDADDALFGGLPMLVDAPDDVVAVSAGLVHSALLAADGIVWTAGRADDEASGLGRAIDVVVAGAAFLPVTTVDSATGPPKFTQVFASKYYTVAVDEEGRVWSTGNNYYGQLCRNDTSNRERFAAIPLEFYNASEGDGNGTRIANVALGEAHTLLLREDGAVFGCGWNAYGQLGLGNDTMVTSNGSGVLLPTRIAINETVVGIAAGRGSSYFLTETNNVYVVGTNYDGQLCLGDRADRTLPTLLNTLPDEFDSLGQSVQAIAAGTSSLYLLMSDGRVFACGLNAQGQLGLGDFVNATSTDVPTLIPTLRDVVSVFSGPSSYGAYFVQENGTVFAAGYNGGGQLGVGDVENRYTPAAVACSDEASSENREMASYVRISSGNDHALFLGTTSTFLCPDDDHDAENATTTSPAATASPADTREPTPSPTLTARPTESAAPTTATASPTAAAENSTRAPSFVENESSGMPTASYGPTVAPSYGIPLSGDRAVESGGAAKCCYECASWSLVLASGVFIGLWI